MSPDPPENHQRTAAARPSEVAPAAAVIVGSVPIGEFFAALGGGG